MCNETMVYLDKIFSNHTANSCPLMTEIFAHGETFNQQLTFFDENGCNNSNCGCGCGCFDVEEDWTFTVETTEVFINDFDLANPCDLSTQNVTVDGLPVDRLDSFNERYRAATSDLMTRISDCTCIEKGLPTKGYFLICNAGPWKAKLTIVIHGSAFTCGQCKRFKLCLTTKNGVHINIPGQSTFAVSSICLPCTTGGIAPVINFSFKADANLLNPCLEVDHCGRCNLKLTGCLIVEPEVEIEVTRQTLFRTNAEVVNVPCDDLAKCEECSGTCDSRRDSRPVRVRDKCCTDENGDRDCDRDKDCDRDRDRKNNICCQFNGRNGCTF